VICAVLYECALVAYFDVHVSGRSPWVLALGVSVPLLAGALVVRAGMLDGPRGLGPKAALLALATTMAPLFFATASVLALPPDPRDGRYWHHAIGCVVTGACLVAGPLALLALGWRRAFAAAAAWRTAALGVGCGALAATTLSFVCPLATAGHVAVAHGAALVLGGLVGAGMARLTIIR
jgi:hypothetical protein